MHHKTIAQIQIYSGRRNPQWELTEKQKRVFIELWDAAKTEKQKINLPSQLGYQGFVVWDNLYRWIIFRGHIHRLYDKIIETKIDADNSIESFLKQTIPKSVAPEIKKFGL